MIVRFDDGILGLASEVYVFKIPHYKSKLEGNASIDIFPEVINTDVQLETLMVWKLVFIPFCLMKYLLDKNLISHVVLLPIHMLIQTSGITCCNSILDLI